MTLEQAIDLLRPSHIPALQPATWADLGCGSGLFTHALAGLLTQGSRIHAVDRQDNFKRTPTHKEVSISFSLADMVKDDLPFDAVDGILMGNALHYVKDKTAFLQKLSPKLSANGMLIVIEYETTQANQWVPYPITFTGLQQLLRDNGFSHIHKTNQRPSIYNAANMYVATITR